MRDRIFLVDVYGAMGQDLLARARAEGRRWRVTEVIPRGVAVNVALLHPEAGDKQLSRGPWGVSGNGRGMS